MRRIFKKSNLKYVVAFLAPLILTMIIVNCLDNDSWGVLAEGRYVINNGVHYYDVFSMHDGLEYISQGYGFSVIFWLIYSAFGPTGIYIGMLLLNFIICFLLYKICMLLSKKNINLSLLVMMVTDIMLILFGFVTTRAQMISYVIFLALIYVLELYINTGKWKYLCWAPLLSLLQVNLHASLWLMISLVFLVYVIDSKRAPLLHLQGYKKIPLLVAWLAVLLVGFINPYGSRMLTLIFSAYGDSVFMNLVVELRSFDLRTIDNVLLYLAISTVLVLYIFGNGKNMRMRYLLMFFGFLALGLNSVKGMSQFILVMFLPLALVYKNVRIEKVIEAKIGRKAVMLWSGVVVLVLFVVITPVAAMQVKESADEAIITAIDIMDEEVEKEGKEKGEMKVYVGYNDGGYVEFRGYRAYLDPGGVIFLKKDEEGDSVLHEWVRLEDGKENKYDFLSKYEFDFLLVRSENDPLYNLKDERYFELYQNEEYQTKVFKKMQR